MAESQQVYLSHVDLTSTIASPLRILHLLSQRPDSTGSGVYLQAMLREATACNHDNFLVAGIESTPSATLDFIDQRRCMFVKFCGADLSYPIVGMSDVMPYPSVRFSDLSQTELHEYEGAFARHLEAAVTRFEPDIIHSHHLWIVSSLARRLFPEMSIVATCHGSDLRQFQNCPHLQDRVLGDCRRLNAVMALTAAQKQEIARLYGLRPGKITVVGAGYDDALFTPNPKPDPHPVQIVYAGKLSNAKGVPWLLRAVSRIESPPWILHLVGGGDGGERDDCLTLARQLGKRILVHGAISHESLAAIMKRAHILVLPSFYEGLPLVVLEGLASGCRIVATDLPGLKEILGDLRVDSVSLVKTPRLRFLDQPCRDDETAFEHDLAQALQWQIRAAYQHPEIDISALGNRVASFSWKGIFGKVQRVYSEVVKT